MKCWAAVKFAVSADEYYSFAAMWAEEWSFLHVVPGEAGLGICHRVRTCLIAGRPPGKGRLEKGERTEREAAEGLLAKPGKDPRILGELLSPGVGDTSLLLVEMLDSPAQGAVHFDLSVELRDQGHWGSGF